MMEYIVRSNVGACENLLLCDAVGPYPASESALSVRGLVPTFEPELRLIRVGKTT
jgi:hypothetical protein